MANIIQIAEVLNLDILLNNIEKASFIIQLQVFQQFFPFLQQPFLICSL